MQFYEIQSSKYICMQTRIISANSVQGKFYGDGYREKIFLIFENSKNKGSFGAKFSRITNLQVTERE